MMCAVCMFDGRRQADQIEQLQADLAALVELGKERDYAMEMVNVQDNQIDALRALLKSLSDEVQRTWYNADSYAESQRGLTCIKRKIDAALAGDKP